MDAMEAILTRRSVRKFTGEIIPDELYDKLLRAAMQAPSARNDQPWQFIIIDNRDTMDAISRFHPYAQMLNKAAGVITVCGDRRLEQNVGYIALDCAAASENILLAAHALGLGAVWLGVYPRTERMRSLSGLLNLPENIIPISMIALGIPEVKSIPENRYQQTRVHRNTWTL